MITWVIKVRHSVSFVFYRLLTFSVKDITLIDFEQFTILI